MPILTDDERIGTLIAGKYEVRGVLARGGMGVLFEGVHSWTGRRVAIKLLHPGASADPAVVAARFVREGRAATALNHPHVVDVLDMGQADDGALFMVLELLEGADLSKTRQSRGPIAAADAVELLSPIIDALATAHAAGIVHRDIKPGNVFLARQADGSVSPRLLDFGIAKAFDEGDTQGTNSGVIVGTPHYMSPEQAEGATDVGPASDTWALGVLLYELVSGVLPYDAASPTAILMTILQRPHTPLSEVASSASPALAAAIERALARAPDARPRDLRAWIAELRAAAGVAPLATPLVSAVTFPVAVAERALQLDRFPTLRPLPAAPPRASTRERSPPWLAIGAGLVLVVLVVGAAVAWQVTRPEPVARALALPPSPASVAPAAPIPSVIEVPPASIAAETPAMPPPPTGARPSHPTRPVRVPSGPAAHGHRPITTITTEW